MTSTRVGSDCVTIHTTRSLPPSAVMTAGRGSLSLRLGIRACGSHSSIDPASATMKFAPAAPAVTGTPRDGNWYGARWVSVAVSTAAPTAPTASACAPTLV